MNRSTLAFAISALLFGAAAPAALAEPGPWLVRARAVHLNPADKSDPIGGVGSSDRITLEQRTIPELDISYAFTPNLSAELVLTVPQRHDVMLDGASIGTLRHLPPILLAQYRFDPIERFTPYLGAGLNYTRFSSVRLLDGAAELENHSTGLALQAGVDFALDRQWSFNLDLKRVNIRSDVTIGGARASRVKVDPTLLAFGLGYRF